ncbi:MAG: toll/interleukin-1 receptor domain-containing protein [Clostridia bacterium]|nr:toll/interleukin-1 receptor domain-containing protein [Clostridia bacterium]
MPRNVYEGTERYLFISYSHKDQLKVDRILNVFDENNIRYWYDAGIEIGEEYSDTIAQHINDCYCVVSFISENSKNSKYCKRERHYGIEQLDKIPFTIYLEDVSLSSGEEMMLRSFQTLNYFEFATKEAFEEKVISAPVIKDCKRTDGELTAEEFFNLGINHYLGINHFEQSYVKAINYFTSAAEKGHTKSKYYLGEAYFVGNGVHQDYTKAAEYYLDAADDGYAQAQNSIGLCYKYGDGVEQDAKSAFDWFLSASKLGCVDAQNNLAYCYENGFGTEKRLDKAVQWYKNAAVQGNVQAQYNLGNCLRFGLGVEKNYDDAIVWLKLSAIQGYAQSQTLLGNFYRDGEGVEKNIPEAIRWYKKAADQKIARALIALGQFYETGEGVTQDYEEAIKWYKLAAEGGLAAGKEAYERMQKKMQTE